MSGIFEEGFNDRQVQLIAVIITCLVLSTLAVVLRLLVRWFSAAGFWWDDGVVILALVRLSTIPILEFDAYFF